MAIQVLNTDSDLTGKTLLTQENAYTITGAHTFSRAPGAPFVVTAGSAFVPNLGCDAAQIGGTGFVPVARLGSGTANKTAMLRGDSTWQPLPSSICNGRLTLTTVTPVTTADVTAATTLYFTPYLGSYIGLYDGSAGWDVVKFSEVSIAVPATTNQMYDIFGFSNAGVLTLELLAWTNDTTRATGISLQDGIYVKNGATTRRYLGSFRTTGVSGQTEDSGVKRYIFNNYNRVPRRLTRQESAASWNYTTATWRQANANTANQVEVVIGLTEVLLELSISVNAFSSGGPVAVAVAFGEDSTTTPLINPDFIGGDMNAQTGAGTAAAATGFLRRYPTFGRHFYAWLEKSQAVGTTTWNGTGAGFVASNGIIGSIVM